MEAISNISILKKNHESDKIVSSIAMTILLTSFSMLFATLFLGFIVYRVSSTVWPPLGLERPNQFFPALSSLLCVFSSLALVKFNSLKGSKGSFLYLGICLGLGFLVSQLLLWQELNIQGIYADSGIFGSILFGFSWIHAAHMFCAFIALLFLIPTIHNYEKYEIRALNISKFWHFLGLIWILMYVTLFIL